MCTKVFTAKSNKHILRLNISYFMLSVQRQKYLLHLYVHCITMYSKGDIGLITDILYIHCSFMALRNPMIALHLLVL